MMSIIIGRDVQGFSIVLVDRITTINLYQASIRAFLTALVK